MTTREAMWILWFDSKTSGCSEVDGVIFYGYWGQRLLPEIDPHEFCQLWPCGTVECISWIWKEDYNVNSIEMKIVAHPAPEDWLNLLDAALGWFIKHGAIVSWCGNELSMQSIECLGPDGGDGLVYGGYSAPTGLLCLSGLDEEIGYLAEAESDALWRVVEESRK